MRKGLLPLVLLAGLVLGVANAAGHATQVTVIQLDVIGNGSVSSDPSGIKCGNDSKKCYIAFSDGSDIDLTPKDGGNGWTFEGWDDLSEECANTADDPCTVPGGSGLIYMRADFTKSSGTSQATLSVTYDDTSGDGNVDGSFISCGSSGSDCTETVLKGSVLTLAQSPDSGSVFTGWGGECDGQGESCVVQMDGDKFVSAVWGDAAVTAKLTVGIVGSGHVSGGGIDCPTKCVANQTTNTAVTLNASPSDGYVFSSWSAPCSGSSPVCTVTMDSDADIVATFTPASTLTVNITGNGGITGNSGAINCGLGANICSGNFASTSASRSSPLPPPARPSPGGPAPAAARRPPARC